jgi:hypothetical protein
MDWGTAVLIAAFGIVVTLLVVIGCLVLAYLLIRRSIASRSKPEEGKMANPFQYLQDRQEAAEAKRRRKEEAEQAAKELEERRLQERTQAADQYNEMVRRVLRPLAQALREEGVQRQKESLGEYGGAAWSVGHDYRYDRPCDIAWSPKVIVSLEFNDRNQPTRFKCLLPYTGHNERLLFCEWWVEDTHVYCALTEEALIKALRRILP